MKLMAAFTVAACASVAQTGRATPLSVTAVRHWSMIDVTRVAIEVTGDFQFRTDRLHNPERVYYDILNSRPSIESHRIFSEAVTDRLISRIRVAETLPGVTRVVLDLNGMVEVSASQLINPNRLVIELRPGAAPAIPTAPPSPIPTLLLNPAAKPPVIAPNKVVVAAAAPLEEIALDKPITSLPAPAPAVPAETGKAARRTSAGETSLVRALGLKIQRVVIDPGHGGHDQGTEGAKGLLEKDLVLDVAQRVGKLIEEHMGAEVIYTRTDDTFVPLEGRTALANEKKADLFLSIHANSSPYPRVSGMETYYLNFTDSKDALNVASRENASSQKSVFELRDLIQQISLHDKAEESRDFAGRLQAALFAFSAHDFPSEKNRGVRKAPFVVLIGANMPSVLAEIGFLSNPREESLLKKSDYRQKLAESLYRGISKYADSLSHFQLAKTSATPPI